MAAGADKQEAGGLGLFRSAVHPPGIPGFLTIVPVPGLGMLTPAPHWCVEIWPNCSGRCGVAPGPSVLGRTAYFCSRESNAMGRAGPMAFCVRLESRTQRYASPIFRI